jgi:hypothetical protein
MNKFNIVEKINSNAMHLSNCLDNPEQIVSLLELKLWTKDTDPVGVGSLCFLTETEPGYKEVDEAFLHAAEIFLSSTNRDIKDYIKSVEFHRAVRWETKHKPIEPHKDVWEPEKGRFPDVTLVMYLITLERFTEIKHQILH